VNPDFIIIMYQVELTPNSYEMSLEGINSIENGAMSSTKDWFHKLR
jgi:hypothetical protein